MEKEEVIFPLTKNTVKKLIALQKSFKIKIIKGNKYKGLIAEYLLKFREELFPDNRTGKNICLIKKRKVLKKPLFQPEFNRPYFINYKKFHTRY